MTKKKAAPAPVVEVETKDDAYGVHEPIRLFTSGCAILDAALGGGWTEGRVINVVGDKSTGKTQLAIEAAANFVRKHPEGRVRYIEPEAAFDRAYAELIGLPKGNLSLATSGEPESEENKPIDTVEQFYADLVQEVDWAREAQRPLLYIVDSLDALSDDAETKREMDEGSYGAAKAKKLSEMFRRIVRKLREHNVTLFVISQIRAKLNVTFGAKTTRSGGKALDFYASQIVDLDHIGRISREVDKVKRVVGIEVEAEVTKNKAGPPFRKARYPIYFSYGIHDLVANTEWLVSVGKESVLGEIMDERDGKTVTAAQFLRWAEKQSKEEYGIVRELLGTRVQQAWDAIEASFATARTKY